MRRASGQPRLSHGFTLKSGPRSFNLPTRRRSCCSTSPLPKVDLVELVSPALSSVTELPFEAQRLPRAPMTIWRDPDPRITSLCTSPVASHPGCPDPGTLVLL